MATILIDVPPPEWAIRAGSMREVKHVGWMKEDDYGHPYDITLDQATAELWRDAGHRVKEVYA